MEPEQILKGMTTAQLDLVAEILEACACFEFDASTAAVVPGAHIACTEAVRQPRFVRFQSRLKLWQEALERTYPYCSGGRRCRGTACHKQEPPPRSPQSLARELIPEIQRELEQHQARCHRASPSVVIPPAMH